MKCTIWIRCGYFSKRPSADREQTAVLFGYELLFGVARAKKEIGENALLGVMNILSFDGKVAKRAAELHAELISQNQDIGIKDVFIAASCLQEEMPILTANKRHFSRVPELEVITPEELLTIDL